MTVTHTQGGGVILGGGRLLTFAGSLAVVFLLAVAILLIRYSGSWVFVLVTG